MAAVKSIAEEFLQAATHAPQPMQAEERKASSAFVFSTIVELDGNKLSKEEMEKIILIEVPSKIYKELRRKEKQL